MRLANLTWPKAQEYFEKNDMVLISIGSIEWTIATRAISKRFFSFMFL